MLDLLDSLDESTGDGIGDALTDSSTGYTSDSLDELGTTGSGLQLDYNDAGILNFGVDTQPSGLADLSFSGASDPAPAWEGSLGISDNGSGHAPSTHALSPSGDASGFSLLSSAFSKFGSTFGALLAHNPDAPGATVGTGAPPPGSNPNVNNPAGISRTNTIVLLAVLVGLVIVLSLPEGR